MENLVIYLLLFAAVCTKDIWCKNLGNKMHRNNSRIAGGETTTIEQYPYQALLTPRTVDNMDHRCGGSIISETVILTAAHCVIRAIYIRVRIGSTYDNTGGQVYNTTDFDTHPFFDAATGAYNIALVFIQEGMELNGRTTKAINLVSEGNDPTTREHMIITGFGSTRPGGSLSHTLREGEVPVVDREDCEDILRREISDSLFCAEGDLEDTCVGDGGGPAVSTISGDLAGVSSYGLGCNDRIKPSLYNRIGQIYVRVYIRMVGGV